MLFRLDKPIRIVGTIDCSVTGSMPSADIFDGLDNTNDSSSGTQHQRRITHQQCSSHDLDQLARLFGDLDEASSATLRTPLSRVATRSELVKLGLIKEKDAFAGDPETDIAVFKLCLQHCPNGKAMAAAGMPTTPGSWELLSNPSGSM